MSRRTLLWLPLLLLLPRRSGHKAAVHDEPGTGAERSIPNVLILLFDAFSARNASLYGYPRRTTPNLARFAARATVYHAHYSAGSFTPSGTASLLTGTYPWSHGALHLAGRVTQSTARRNLFRVLGERGRQTVAYSHNLLANMLLLQFDEDLSAHLDPGQFCLSDHRLSRALFAGDPEMASRGLDHFAMGRGGIPGSPLLSLLDATARYASEAELGRNYSEEYPRGLPDVDYRRLLFRLEDAIDGIPQVIGALQRPYLAYFHLYPPHTPYRPRREFVGLFDDVWRPTRKVPHFFSEGHSQERLDRLRVEYDEYVAYTDAEFGRLCEHMAEKGMLENTYLIVTSDHGEMFERGIWAHMTPTLYEPIIRVPLLISRPGQTQREDVHTPTSAVDLLPTLCHVTGQPIPEWCEGEILPGFAPQAPGPARSVYAVDAKSNPQRAPLSNATVALINGRYKLIYYLGYPGHDDQYELYDVQDDPEEMTDLYRAQTAVAAELRSELLEKLHEVNESRGA